MSKPVGGRIAFVRRSVEKPIRAVGEEAAQFGEAVRLLVVFQVLRLERRLHGDRVDEHAVTARVVGHVSVLVVLDECCKKEGMSEENERVDCSPRL